MKRILVIEDEHDVRESILDILNAESYYAMSAENGRIGVKVAQDFQPDLIICDVMMPELDGYGVLTQLRQHSKLATVPFVFLTAKADKADWRQGMDLGADDYLTKPFSHDELLRAITARLGKQQAINEESQHKLDELRQSISLALPHELNTTLSVIAGLSSILIDEYDTATRTDILEMAQSIYANSKRLHRLVHNFLLIAKLDILAASPEQLKLFQNSYMTDTASLITETAIRKAEEFERESDLELEVEPTDAPLSESQLKKIVEELVDNALKFSSPGSHVRIFSSRIEDRFVLYVIDYGRGMTIDQINKIGAYMQFDRQVQEQSGVGLGLTIVKRLVELHNGKLLIESIPGKQTIVRISIPD